MKKNSTAKKDLTQAQGEELIKTLKTRFEKNMKRHEDVKWDNVQKKLEALPDALWSLFEMERTGGEPDVVTTKKSEITFYDCSAESPSGRRNICYDKEGEDERKGLPVKGNAVDMAAEMGIVLLDEEHYRELQKHVKFDLKTSSWIKTPDAIRKLGGALFGDNRYEHIFIYHNGAQSFYAARGFRGMLRI